MVRAKERRMSEQRILSVVIVVGEKCKLIIFGLCVCRLS
jgi:hypothetical protein